MYLFFLMKIFKCKILVQSTGRTPGHRRQHLRTQNTALKDPGGRILGHIRPHLMTQKASLKNSEGRT